MEWGAGLGWVGLQWVSVGFRLVPVGFTEEEPSL